jgi:tRNA G37 N-methylase TrmD
MMTTALDEERRPRDRRRHSSAQVRKYTDYFTDGEEGLLLQVRPWNTPIEKSEQNS